MLGSGNISSRMKRGGGYRLSPIAVYHIEKAREPHQIRWEDRVSMYSRELIFVR